MRTVPPSCRNFNPRSHEGSDTDQDKLVLGESISIHAPTRGATKIFAIKAPKDEFQSTLPRGERPLMPKSPKPGDNFNPRSHEGSDLFAVPSYYT